MFRILNERVTTYRDYGDWRHGDSSKLQTLPPVLKGRG